MRPRRPGGTSDGPGRIDRAQFTLRGADDEGIPLRGRKDQHRALGWHYRAARHRRPRPPPPGRRLLLARRCDPVVADAVSEVALAPDDNNRWSVVQRGRCRLWDTIETAITTWRSWASRHSTASGSRRSMTCSANTCGSTTPTGSTPGRCRSDRQAGSWWSVRTPSTRSPPRAPRLRCWAACRGSTRFSCGRDACVRAWTWLPPLPSGMGQVCHVVVWRRGWMAAAQPGRRVRCPP